MSKKRIRKDLLVICSILVVCSLGIAIFYQIDPWGWGAELLEAGGIYVEPWGYVAVSKADVGDFIPPVLAAILSVFVIRQALWAKWVLGIFFVGNGLFNTISEFFMFGLVINVLALDPSPHRLRFLLSFGVFSVMGLFFVFVGIYMLVTVKKRKVYEKTG